MTTAREIVTAALEELLYFPAEETPAAVDVKTMLAYLNRMMAAWPAEGIVVSYPTGTNWRGYWSEKTSYANNDAVLREGFVYRCFGDHTSTLDDAPGVSVNWATYWTEYAYTALTLESTFPLSMAYEEGIISMLAMRGAPAFSVTPTQMTADRARDGWQKISAAYMRTPVPIFDPALTRLPSRRGPYASSQTIEG